jgi:hypothetical protein
MSREGKIYTFHYKDGDRGSNSRITLDMKLENPCPYYMHEILLKFLKASGYDEEGDIYNHILVDKRDKDKND